MSFYNTVNIAGPELKAAEKRCTEQEAYILRLMLKCDPDNKGMTTGQVYQVVRERKQKTFRAELEKKHAAGDDFSTIWEFMELHYCKLQTALISIRRSMTDLTKCDPPKLVKTDKKRKGSSGIGNHIYKRIETN